mgnify:CR=1 FL=1
MKKTILFLAFLFTISLTAQEIKLSGTVTDESKIPLSGVSVSIQGTKIGTQTTVDGTYTITAKIGAILQFSYIGFESKKATVSGSTLNITLTEGGEALKEVVIGSRNPTRTLTESAVPIDVISMREIVTKGSQTNLKQILNMVAPTIT